MAKQASLAKQEGALEKAPQLTLPAIFSAPVDKVKGRYTAPYITFAHPKRADEWQKLVAKFKRVDEGEMYFIRQDDLRKLDNAKLSLIACKQYWAEANPAGEVLRTTWSEKPKPYKEHIEAVVLVYFDDEVVPANVQFRTTKCPAGKALADALVQVTTPEWAELGQAHKDSLIIQQPFGRFYGIISLGDKRTSRTSGLPYRPTLCDIQPTSTPEWRLLKLFSESPDSQKALQDAADRYQWRLEDVTKKLVA